MPPNFFLRQQFSFLRCSQLGASAGAGEGPCLVVVVVVVDVVAHVVVVVVAHVAHVAQVAHIVTVVVAIVAVDGASPFAT